MPALFTEDLLEELLTTFEQDDILTEVPSAGFAPISKSFDERITGIAVDDDDDDDDEYRHHDQSFVQLLI